MNFVQVLLTTTHQLHVYHWQTDSYAAHQAFGQAYDALDGLMDNFVEVFMGKYGKVASKDGFDINLANITDKKPGEFIDSVIDFLTNELPKSLKDNDTDLLNIRDEMIAELNKLKYLLTLE
jgi:DNA-binding ferritin-like protein